MDIIRLCAWGYAALLGFVILTGYIPAFIDQNDMIFGLFRRTWYADGLHLVSALWAAIAAFAFPEWYIVYSFEDFGRFLDRGSESGFNYLGHILGFWRSFCTINRAVPATESRSEVKTMIYVIGVSYSIEYAIKGIYENTIGRVFEWIRGEQRTPQDEYARAVLQD